MNCVNKCLAHWRPSAIVFITIFYYSHQLLLKSVIYFYFLYVDKDGESSTAPSLPSLPSSIEDDSPSLFNEPVNDYCNDDDITSDNEGEDRKLIYPWQSSI